MGTTLSVYRDVGTEPPNGPVVSTAIVSAASSATLTGLTPGVAYQAGALLGGKWIGVLVEVPRRDLPSDGSVVTAAGPLTSADVDGYLDAGQTLYELDGSGQVVAEWVKVP